MNNCMAPTKTRPLSTGILPVSMTCPMKARKATVAPPFLTLNGGATVAFLAFIGHVMETGKMPVESGRVFVGAMQLFIYGAFLAVLAYGTIFLTNCLSLVEWRRASNGMFVVTLLFASASMGCYLAASWRSIRG